MKTHYLFIRILEACNAKCFMCGFASSNDRHRFSLAEFEDLLPEARGVGVEVVRLTGGEPLLHRDTVALVRAGTDAGMKMSVITNGALLPERIDGLAEAGLAQVIVSIDGDSAETHDRYRHTPGLFDRCVAGLQRARDHGVRTRVNTVVGPHNYEQMPRLQGLLTGVDVEQWELSAIKLDRPVVYADPEHVRAVCSPIYEADPRSAIVPMGKRFYGDTQAELERFFGAGVPPRASPPRCNLVGEAIYIDAKAGTGYGCPMLPHRSLEESGGGVQMRTDRGWKLDGKAFQEHVGHFRVAGPRACTGCSTTAAGYSDEVADSGTARLWHY